MYLVIGADFSLRSTSLSRAKGASGKAKMLHGFFCDNRRAQSITCSLIHTHAQLCPGGRRFFVRVAVLSRMCAGESCFISISPHHCARARSRDKETATTHVRERDTSDSQMLAVEVFQQRSSSFLFARRWFRTSPTKRDNARNVSATAARG